MKLYRPYQDDGSQSAISDAAHRIAAARVEDYKSAAMFCILRDFPRACSHQRDLARAGRQRPELKRRLWVIPIRGKPSWRSWLSQEQNPCGKVAPRRVAGEAQSLVGAATMRMQ